MEIFKESQGPNTPIDEFICKKRALLAQIPGNRHDEETQLDLVYGMLNLHLRKRVSRDQVNSFTELLQKARQIEEIQNEASSVGTKATTENKPKAKASRCNFCHFRGHKAEECRKRLATTAPKTTSSDDKEGKQDTKKPEVNVHSTVSCYGCGKIGYYRSNCPTCSQGKADISTHSVQFYAINTITPFSTQVPTVPIMICGIKGYAHLDTAAKTSIAGTTLYECLKEHTSCQFHKIEAEVTLADGLRQTREVLSTSVNVEIGDRTLSIDFVVLPDAEDNRTLLGIDFLEKAGIVVNPPQRCWNFIDEPQKRFDFLDLGKGKTPDLIHKPHKRIPLENMTNVSNTTIASATVEEVTSPFLEFFCSPLSMNTDNKETDDIVYKLHPISPTPEPQPSENSSDYSPGMIYDIFKDSLPDTYSPPQNKRDPRLKRRKLDFFTIDVTLQHEEATELAFDEKQSLNKVLVEFQDIFKENGPPTQYAEHRIDTRDHPPIACAPYRMNIARQEILKRKLDDMLEKGIIEESETPWASPVVMVPKKTNDFRVCVDYRRLNSITKPDRYPLPRIDDLLHAAKGKPYMTSLDLQTGYWQIEVRESDRDKTGFITPFGIYRFTRMPFGLRNAPSTFQRLMDRFRVTLSNVSLLVYLDDLIIRSATFQEHLKDLSQVFEQLRNFQLRVNRNKCKFSCSQIKYLGHLITKDGICVDPDKTNAIVLLPSPSNLKQLLSFIQTCSWYRRFVPDFAKIAQPLTNLTRKGAAWKWGTDEQEAYDKLKASLTTTPILKQADEQQPFIVKTDASNYAIGAVLVQGEGENEHPIEYASRLLSSAERNYTTTEREALAIVWAVTTKFRGYIEGSEVILVTDHQPLKWLMNLKTPTGRLARWALQLQSYNLKIQYSPGKTNVIADFLSRPPCSSYNEDCSICNVQIDLPRQTEREIREKQLEDSQLKEIINALEDPPNEEVTRKWFNRGYFLHKGVLYRYTNDQEDDDAKLLIPAGERSKILQSYHDSATAGHCGIDNTVNRIAKRYFWPGMRQDIAKYVSNCVNCQRYKVANRKPAGLMQTTSINQRFEVLAVDLFGPLPPSEDAKRWILIIEDTASRWVELFALEEASAANCAHVLLDEVFLRYGLPRRIVSDNGTQFVSAVVQKLTFCLGIKQSFIPVYHAEANPVERRNRDLKTQLGILVGKEHQTWSQHLPAIRFAINTARCESTGHTAAYLTFGRELRAPQDVTYDLSNIVQSENFVPDITPKLKRLAETMKLAQEITEARQDRNQKYTDLVRRPSPEYAPGDKVWVQTHPLSKASSNYSAKLAPRRDGPYIILRKHGPTSYEVAAIENPAIPLGTYHASSIAPYVGENLEVPSPVRPLRKRGRPKKTSTDSMQDNPQLPSQLATKAGTSSRRSRSQRGRL